MNDVRPKTGPYDPFYRSPRLIWIADRETMSGESATRFFVMVEPVYPARIEPNEIIRVDGIVPVHDKYNPAKVRFEVMKAYRRMVETYFKTSPDRGEQ